MAAWLRDGSSDVGASIDCAVSAIDQFTARVSGQADGRYSREEMAQVLGTYLLRNGSTLAHDTDAWTRAAMTMKQLAFGGTTESISKPEVAKIRAFLLRVKPFALRLTPHMRTIFFQGDVAQANQSLAAGRAVEDLMSFLGREFTESTMERPTMTPESVMASAHRLGIDSSKLDDWIPLAKAIKSIVVGGDRSRVRADEWTPLLSAAGRVWAISIRGYYDVWNNSGWLGDRLASTEALVNGVVDLMAEGVRRHEDGIPLNEWEAAVDAVAAKSLFPRHVTASTVKRLLPIIFGKLLYGVSKTDGVSRSMVFGETQLAELRSLVRNWILGQKLILAVFADRGVMTDEILTRSLDSEDVLRTARIPNSEREAALRAKAEIRSFAADGRPLVRDTSHRLVIMPRDELPAISRSDLDLINVVRVVGGAIIRGWAHDPQAVARMSGVTEAEAQEIYLDLKMFGREMGLMDIRNNAAGIRTFMEASIFTSVSDGNERVNLREGVEWFHFVLGAGLLADRIYARIVDAGCGTGVIDVMGKQKVSVNCFRENFLRSFSEDFPNLPHLSAWVAADRSGERTRQVLAALESATRNRGVNDIPIESSEFRAMIPILHYTESLFARHDTNRNGFLDREELWQAFPIMQRFIRKLGNGHAEDEGMQRAIFSYLIQFGQPPPPTLVGGLGVFGWRFVDDVVNIRADRLGVLKVMGSFARANRDRRGREIATFLNQNRSTLRRDILNRESQTVARMTELFQCHADSAAVVGDVLRRRIDFIIPTPVLTPEQFVARVENALGQDTRLSTHCLPF